MGDVVKLFEGVLGTPVPQLLVVAGLVFLALAVVGNISGKIEPGRVGRMAAGGIGGTLMTVGLAMQIAGPSGPPQRAQAMQAVFSTAQPQPTGSGSSATPVCSELPSGRFGQVWGGDAGVRQLLGCAIGGAHMLDGVEQPFLNGHMIYRVDTRSITVLLADTTRELRDVGFWEEHQDRFREGAEPEPPYVGEPLTPGLLVPERGFGKLWRDDGRLRHKLNFASGVELGFRGAAQQFERGRMLLTGTGEPQAPTVWVLSSGGGYRRFPLP